VQAKAGDTASVDATVDLSEIRKPFFAYVGAADFAVQKLRSLPSLYVEGVRKGQTQVKELPTQVRERYDDFARRGHELITSVRQDPATQRAVAEAKAAAGQVEEAGEHAANSVRAAGKAAEDTAEKIGR
jgi:hypothetical protein